MKARRRLVRLVNGGVRDMEATNKIGRGREREKER